MRGSRLPTDTRAPGHRRRRRERERGSVPINSRGGPPASPARATVCACSAQGGRPRSRASSPSTAARGLHAATTPAGLKPAGTGGTSGAPFGTRTTMGASTADADRRSRRRIPRPLGEAPKPTVWPPRRHPPARRTMRYSTPVSGRDRPRQERRPLRAVPHHGHRIPQGAAARGPELELRGGDVVRGGRPAPRSACTARSRRTRRVRDRSRCGPRTRTHPARLARAPSDHRATADPSSETPHPLKARSGTAPPGSRRRWAGRCWSGGAGPGPRRTAGRSRAGAGTRRST